MVLWLAFYLVGCASWGRRLQSRNATLRQRRIRGLIVAAAWLVLYLGGNTFQYAMGAVGGVLGYVTIVHIPRWIVGDERTVVHGTADKEGPAKGIVYTESEIEEFKRRGQM